MCGPNELPSNVLSLNKQAGAKFGPLFDLIYDSARPYLLTTVTSENNLHVGDIISAVLETAAILALTTEEPKLNALIGMIQGDNSEYFKCKPSDAAIIALLSSKVEKPLNALAQETLMSTHAFLTKEMGTTLYALTPTTSYLEIYATWTPLAKKTALEIIAKTLANLKPTSC